MTHSPEPWKFVNDHEISVSPAILDANDNCIIENEMGWDEKLEVDFARATACVNALAGVPDDRLPDVKKFVAKMPTQSWNDLGDALKDAQKAIERGYGITLSSEDMQKIKDAPDGKLVKLKNPTPDPASPGVGLSTDYLKQLLREQQKKTKKLLKDLVEENPDDT